MDAIRLNLTFLTCICLWSAYVTGALQCKSGWIRHEDVCYHFSHGEEQWVDAETMCRFYDGHLAEIRSTSENNFINTQTRKINRVFWVGGTDNQVLGEWRWIGSGQVLDFYNWNSGEPNNDGTHDNCIQVLPSGTWDDYNCGKELYYICEERAESSEVVG